MRGNFLCHRELPGQGKNIHPVRIVSRALVGLQRHRIDAVEIRGWCDFVVANGEASAICVQIDRQIDWFNRGVVPQLEAERGFLLLCACRGVIIAVYGLVGLLHVGVHRERCLAVGVVGGQCGGSVAHQDALQRNVGNRVALIECGIQRMTENILHAGHTIDGDLGGIHILHRVPEHCRGTVVVHGKRIGAILVAVDVHAGVSKIHELAKGNCDGHVLSAGIGSRRGRDALNDGVVRVQQLGGDVAGIDGGGGILSFAYLISVQIQFEGQIVPLILSVLRGRLQGDADRTALVDRTFPRFLSVGGGRQRCSIELVLRQTERGIGFWVYRTITAIRRRASIGSYVVSAPAKLDAGVDLIWLIKFGGAVGRHRVAGALQNSNSIAKRNEVRIVGTEGCSVSICQQRNQHIPIYYFCIFVFFFIVRRGH